jgi:type I restriction enzyme S subunit
MSNYQLSVKKYSLYKDSGIEWLGDVPEHWEVYQFKNIAFYQEGPGLRNWQFTDEGIKVISVTNITPPTINFEKLKKYISIDEYQQTYKHFTVQKGDLLLASSGASWGKLSTFNLNEKVILNTSTIRIHSAKESYVLTDFIRWILQSGYIYDSLITSLTGSCQPNFGPTHLNRLYVTIPPISEQKSIAYYLDTKTAQCDRKIDLLTQKATQYGKLKQSLINETVTRGLDKSLPMKDSGIEWIGDVPEHWEIQRLHDIAVHQKTKNIGLIEKNLLSLSYGKIKRRDIDTSFGLLPESFETYQIVEEGNIILRLTDLQNDQRSLRVGLAREKGIITSAYLCLKFLKNIHPVFAYYLLFIYDISKVFYWFGGGLRQSMKFDDVKVFPFVIPPLSEQKAIADYLDKKTAQIDQIIQTINTQIEKLKELRKTLINDVVTGKIKV